MLKLHEFEFDLTVQLPPDAPDGDELIDALFEAGFDDVVVGVGAPGIIGLSFVRDGTDIEAVIADATAAALDSLPAGAMVISVTRHD